METRTVCGWGASAPYRPGTKHQIKDAPPNNEIQLQPTTRTESVNGFTPMKALLKATAIIELGAGLALLCFPPVAALLLVGQPLEAPAALIVARVGGTGLLTLGVACWLARGDTKSRAARGLVTAMVLYNSGAVLILAAFGIRSQTIGVVLWPAVALHAAMAFWCSVGLLSGKPTD